MGKYYLPTLILLLVMTLVPTVSRGQANELFVKWKDGSVTRHSKTSDDLKRRFRIQSTGPAFKTLDKIRGKSLPGSKLHRLTEHFEHLERWVVSDDISAHMIASKLSQHPDIEYAEPVPVNKLLYTPNDPEYDAGNQFYLSVIKAAAAWDTDTGDPNVLIAIIDSGIDIDHPDLQGNLWTNPNESLNQADDDNNGYTDDINGWDFFNDDNDVRPSSGNTHGTHVAGIAAATTDNGVGVASISFNASYLPLKIGSDDGSSLAFGYEAILYAAAMGADVINCSWGSTQYSQTAADIIKQVTEDGSLVVAAGGNDNNQSIYYPAGYTEAIAVANTQNDGTKSLSSNYGPFIDVNAPGTNIYSTFPNNTYGTSSGTSMASPVVAGLAALIKSTFPDIDNDQIRAQLLGTATRISLGNDTDKYLIGRGQVRADVALGNLVQHPELIAHTVSDEPGNNNGVLEAGETIQISGTIKNFGIETTGARLVVESLNTDKLEIISNGTQDLPTLSHSETFAFTPVQMRITNSATIDEKVIVKFNYELSDGTTFDAIEVTLLPSYATLTANSIEVSTDGYGHIGYSDYPDNSVGTGFIIRSTSTQVQQVFNTPLLYEGGLFFGDGGSNSPSNNEFRISDHLRGSSGSQSNIDFEISQPVHLKQQNGDQVAELVYTDVNAGSEAYNIQVSQESYAYGDTGHDQYLISIYNFQNDSSTPLNDFNAGLFFDFDLPGGNLSGDDYGVYDDVNDIVIMQPESGDNVGLYIGLTAIGGIHTPWVINNAIEDNNAGFYFGLYDGFTDEEKWTALSTGLTSAGSQNREVSSSDVSISASAQPIALSPGESEKVGFIIAYGTTKDQLLTQITNARQRAEDRQLTTIERIQEPGSEHPTKVSISSVYPNPFNPTTTIEYTLDQSRQVQLAVYDQLGRQVQLLHDGRQSRGTYKATFNGNQLASGIYYILLKADGAVLDRKAVTLLK